MWNYKIKTSFGSPEMPKARPNKTGFNSKIYILLFVENVYNTMLYMIFLYVLELVLIQQLWSHTGIVIYRIVL